MAMKTLSERKRHTSPIDALAPLFPRVRHSRLGYLHLIDELPTPLKELAQKHYEERLRRAGGQPLLGELAPWLIADLLDCSDRKQVEEIAIAWLHIYFSVMLLDDIIDSPSRLAFSEHLVLVSLLQQRGISRLLALSPSPSCLQKTIDKAFTDTAEAASRELNRRARGFGCFPRSEVSLLGQKLALVRICVESISNETDVSSDKHRSIQKVFTDLLVALQLLDDITDWKEDYATGNVTLPLSLAYRRSHLSKNQSGPSTESSITLLQLIESRALEQTLKDTLSFLRKANITLDREEFKRGSTCHSYVALLIETGDEVLETLRNAHAEIHRFDHNRQTTYFFDLTPPQHQRLLETIVHRVQRSLVTVAQSS